VKVKKQLHVMEAAQIMGKTSLELVDRCPDQRSTFPTKPCTNMGCDWAIRQAVYMNCCFVASEAGEHTLDAIGEMMDITREGARLIERKALLKVRHSRLLENAHSSVHQPSMAAGPDLNASINESAELEDGPDDVSAFDDRKLA
jgi:hypothetical protein